MALNNALLVSKVAHARQRPKKNAFLYGVYYLAFALDDAAELDRVKLLSRNRGNLFGFFEKDYGDGKTPLVEWVRGVLTQWQVPQEGGRVVMVTLPRLLGYAFNPVSFFFCLDAQGALRAVISEVHNTFGDKHSYISFHEDRSAISQDDLLRAEKLLHVSPFLPVEGHYIFRFAYHEDKIGVWIDYYDADGLMLTTSIAGKRLPLTSASLLKMFVACPFVTLKVISLIHYQALRLWLKGIKYFKRPDAPVSEVSR